MFVQRQQKWVGLLTTRDAEGPPLAVTMQPWGAVRVRIDDPADDRNTGFVYARAAVDEGDPLFPWSSRFPLGGGNFRTIDRPRFEVAALVPDHPYDIVYGGKDHRVIARGVRVQSGEMLDLGTVRIEPGK